MAHVHICRGTNRRFRGMVRWPGHQKYTPAGPWRKSEKRAYDDMTREFFKDSYKRGEVWFISDYYDPVSVFEMKRS
jgi:hypothetical protein